MWWGHPDDGKHEHNSLIFANMASLFDFKLNFSFYTIPAAWILALAPRLYATTVYESSSSKKFDRKSPRTFTAKCEGDQSIDLASKALILPECW